MAELSRLKRLAVRLMGGGDGLPSTLKSIDAVQSSARIADVVHVSLLAYGVMVITPSFSVICFWSPSC